jgi:glucose-1-phosphate thymidylyltransferase
VNKVVAIIPAAGKGSRLYPFPCPKELFPVGYQAIAFNGVVEKRPKVVSQYLVESLVDAGVSRIFVIVGEGKSDVMRYYGDGTRFGTCISYLFQEKLHGMPSAIDLATPWLIDETVLFGMPDTIIEPKDCFRRLLEYHRVESNVLTLALFPTDNPSKFGMVETDADGSVICTVDKPGVTNLTNMWGAACWSPDFTALIHDYVAVNKFEGQEIVLGDVFNRALELKTKVKGLLFEGGRYIDIGTATDLDFALKQFHL